MKKELLSTVVAATLLFGFGSAYAGQDSNLSRLEKRCQANPKSPKCQADLGAQVTPRAVPEIDATSGAPAIALVLGVALLGAERLRRRSRTATNS